MTRTKGFGPRPSHQKRRYSYKGNSISMIRDANGTYEVGIFFKDGKNFVDRFLPKSEAILLYMSWKRMIKEMV